MIVSRSPVASRRCSLDVFRHDVHSPFQQDEAVWRRVQRPARKVEEFCSLHHEHKQVFGKEYRALRWVVFGLSASIDSIVLDEESRSRRAGWNGGKSHHGKAQR